MYAFYLQENCHKHLVFVIRKSTPFSRSACDSWKLIYSDNSVLWVWRHSAEQFSLSWDGPCQQAKEEHGYWISRFKTVTSSRPLQGHRALKSRLAEDKEPGFRRSQRRVMDLLYFNPLCKIHSLLTPFPPWACHGLCPQDLSGHPELHHHVWYPIHTTTPKAICPFFFLGSSTAQPFNLSFIQLLGTSVLEGKVPLARQYKLQSWCHDWLLGLLVSSRSSSTVL